MTPVVTAIVIAGLLLAVALGAVFGLDVMGLILLALIAAVGVLAVSLARKARAGAIQPELCPSCKGFNSPNAPYCKHCGTHLVRERGSSVASPPER
jgi:hypothetical protein